MLLKKNYKGLEDEKEVSSYWMTLRKWEKTALESEEQNSSLWRAPSGMC